MTADLRLALEELVIGDAEFAELEAGRSVFCPFEAVGMLKQEIRHANFLGYCLDPRLPHGLGTSVLEALLRTAGCCQSNANSSLRDAL